MEGVLGADTLALSTLAGFSFSTPVVRLAKGTRGGGEPAATVDLGATTFVAGFTLGTGEVFALAAFANISLREGRAMIFINEGFGERSIDPAKVGGEEGVEGYNPGVPPVPGGDGIGERGT